MRRRFVTLDVFTNQRFCRQPARGRARSCGARCRDHAGDRPRVQSGGDRVRSAACGSCTPRTATHLYARHRASLRRTSDRRHRGVACADRRRFRSTPDRARGGHRTCALRDRAGRRGVRSRPLRAWEIPVEAGAAADRGVIATALGLKASDIGFDRFEPVRWSAGVPFTFVPIRGLDPIRRCRIDPVHWDAAFGQDAQAAAYMFCRDVVEAGHAFHVRMSRQGWGFRKIRRPDRHPPHSPAC
jgi:hypothetical protein